MLAALTQGHDDLSDALLLIALIVFVLDFVLALISERPSRVPLISVGLACVAAALLVV